LYKLTLSCRGRAIIGQDGRCTELRLSDLVVYDTTRPYEFRFPGHNRLLVVGIPRRMLGVPRGLTSSITARRLTTTGGASRVVASFLRTVHAELDALSGGAKEQRLAALLADMLDPMLGDLGPIRPQLVGQQHRAPPPGLRPLPAQAVRNRRRDPCRVHPAQEA
jgi:AraC-like protein